MDVPYFTTEIPVATIFMDNALVYDMPSLSKKDFRKMLCEIAPKYNSSFAEEIRLMTEIVNPEKTIKVPAKCEEWV